MAIIMIVLAGGFVALSNYFMRRSIDAGGSTRAYLVVQLAISIIIGILFNPVRTGHFAVSTPSLVLGLIGGVILGSMMWSVGRALESGPPGLTFATLNSATVVPGVVMALIFGTQWGHPYTAWDAAGSALVVVGLFWAGWQSESHASKRRWVLLSLLAFTFHALLLSFLQWRALLMKGPYDLSPLVPFPLPAEKGQWFMPMIFVAATLMQLVSYCRFERRLPNKREVSYGIAGGATNGIGTFFLILAPEVATPWQNAMIFPLFAVTVIIICNVWGQMLYKERVNWGSNLLCLFGIVVATVDWRSLFGTL